MAYFGLVTHLQNVHKDPNSDRLYLAECFSEGVIVGEESHEGDMVLYLPTDGQIDRWFGDQYNLFRKNRDGTTQGGYLEDNGHVRAIKLRGNQSSGIVINVDKIYSFFGDQGWSDGDKVNTINNKEFCRKYIPYKRRGAPGAERPARSRIRLLIRVVKPKVLFILSSLCTLTLSSLHTTSTNLNLETSSI